MPLYRIRIKKRFTRIFNGDNRLLLKVSCRTVDGIGIFIEYADGADISDENVRRHASLVGESYCIVEADNAEKAIISFYENWEGAQTGGPGPEAKARWIDWGSPIFEYPYCPHLRTSIEGRFICGEEIVREGCGTRGMCVLEPGIDPPDGPCPISDFDFPLLLRRGEVVKYSLITTNEKITVFLK